MKQRSTMTGKACCSIRPWYHVLVDNAQHMTYVAERNLEPDALQDPIKHPLLDHFFSDFKDGHYISMLH